MSIFQSCRKFNKFFLKIVFLVAVTGLCSIAVYASGGGGEHVEPVSKWHDIDTYKVLNFGVLAIVLFLIAKKPVKAFFTSRITSIENELADLEQKKKDAERKIGALEARLKDLDKESKEIVDSYIKQGESAKARILAQAKEESAKLEDMAKRNIDLEFKTAKSELKKEIAEQAIIEAEKLIKSSISSKDQNKLVGEYLEKVVA